MFHRDTTPYSFSVAVKSGLASNPTARWPQLRSSPTSSNIQQPMRKSEVTSDIKFFARPPKKQPTSEPRPQPRSTICEAVVAQIQATALRAHDRKHLWRSSQDMLLRVKDIDELGSEALARGDEKRNRSDAANGRFTLIHTEAASPASLRPDDVCFHAEMCCDML